MSVVAPRTGFPDPSSLAQAFFEEGIRHLEDAQVLHHASRYAASIASAMKAAEFGIKAVLIQDGALGWWDKMFITHSPLSDISRLPPFDSHIITLSAYSTALVQDVKAMENLVPAKPSGAYELEAQQNPEYPFLSYQVGSVGQSGAFRLTKPSVHFEEADSRKYCNTAQDLLTAVTVQYATLGDWGLALPKPV